MKNSVDKILEKNGWTVNDENDLISHYNGSIASGSATELIIEHLFLLKKLKKRKKKVKIKGISNDVIDKWHHSDTTLELWEFAGLTLKEYETWITNNRKKAKTRSADINKMRKKKSKKEKK